MYQSESRSQSRKYDARKDTLSALHRRIADLNEQSLTQLSQYISYLKWQEELWNSLLDEESERVGQKLIWQFDFLEGFPAARKVSTRDPDLMEIKVGLASCGKVHQSALWQHPPVNGAAVCEYQLAVPNTVDRLSLRFGVGIRDGALMEGENWCAFRIMVNGVRIWSTTKQTNEWDRVSLDLPSLAGQDVVLQFVTDGLGDNRWNWAVWAEPQLLGYGPLPESDK